MGALASVQNFRGRTIYVLLISLIWLTKKSEESNETRFLSSLVLTTNIMITKCQQKIVGHYFQEKVETNTTQFYSRCLEVGKRRHIFGLHVFVPIFFHLKLAEKVVSNNFTYRNLFPAKRLDGFRPSKCQSRGVILYRSVRFPNFGCWVLHAVSDRQKKSNVLKVRIFHQKSKSNSSGTMGLNGFSIIARTRFCQWECHSKLPDFNIAVGFL